MYQEYNNTSSRPVEAKYVFPLDESSVSDSLAVKDHVTDLHRLSVALKHSSTESMWLDA